MRRSDSNGHVIKERRFDAFVVASSVVFAMLLVLHRKAMHRQIFLNQMTPFLIFLSGAVLGFVLLYPIRFFIFKINQSSYRFLTNFVTLVKSLFLSFLIFGTIFSWFFDYLNEKKIRYEVTQEIRCKIYKIIVSSSGTHNTIDFDFLTRKRSINNLIFSNQIHAAAKEKNYDKYFIILKVKKGYLNSFLIMSYDFYVK